MPPANETPGFQLSANERRKAYLEVHTCLSPLGVGPESLSMRGKRRSSAQPLLLNLQRQALDEQWGFAVDNDLKVTLLKEGAPAVQGDLCVGDRIVQVNGHLLLERDLHKLYEAMSTQLQASIGVTRSQPQPEAAPEVDKMDNSERQEVAAIQVQSLYRGSTGRKIFRSRQEGKKQTGAAVKVQSVYRGNSSRKMSRGKTNTNVQLEDKDEDMAAVKVQSWFRGSQARKTIVELRTGDIDEIDVTFEPATSTTNLEQEEAAVQVQSMFRGNQARKQSRMLRPNESALF